MANGAPPSKKERERLPTLFERVTRTGRARPPAHATPPARPATSQTGAAHAAAPPLAATATIAPGPAMLQSPPVVEPGPSQPRLGPLNPADRIVPPRVDDDLLDIPAFLRRQAN
jgi:cell division protein FtsZ